MSQHATHRLSQIAVALTLCALSTTVQAAPTESELLASKAPGPYIHLGPSQLAQTGFSSTQPLVGAIYDDTAPTTNKTQAFRPNDPTDEQSQLAALKQYGVDFIAVSASTLSAADTATSQPDTIIQAINQAAEQMAQNQQAPPKIAVLIGAYQPANLSKPDSNARLYVIIRNVYSQIKPINWATIDNKPIIYLQAPPPTARPTPPTTSAPTSPRTSPASSLT